MPGSLVEIDKYIEVADGCLVIAKQTIEVQIKISDDNMKPFVAVLYNMILASNLCDLLFIHYYVIEFETYIPFS